MKAVFGLNFFVFSILVMALVLYFTKEIRDEGFFDLGKTTTETFGMSPGTMDQLASTRVVSRKEEDIDEHIYNNLTKKGIISMTESGYNDSDYGSTMFS
jgi:hypothetical protein